jgi:hypothetical protein
MAMFHASVLFDYVAEEDTELSVVTGQLVLVTETNESGCEFKRKDVCASCVFACVQCVCPSCVSFVCVLSLPYIFNQQSICVYLVCKSVRIAIVSFLSAPQSIIQQQCVCVCVCV